ncbi:MAP kinase kinase PBS2 [Wickerhamomyces ciferrii]|uniref:mitogen-activated protein kinase kinase n=1 Tax=Wickerhamomyces ciferrii (strain ATCC 14091 / BCRC 22168 / CBS 111 / JCM 3599 / NBRC 0793 / NRRL Y-1031 F-60-10) TaxID=1206466 RepID=K0L0B8_WICCF|nr:MAP kinase kinase PBS2 [Wickerhamomyces ciferrii]CCH46868.1 MAP kinase kinase PBS2 [Wickerhamomyces ciferrii]
MSDYRRNIADSELKLDSLSLNSSQHPSTTTSATTSNSTAPTSTASSSHGNDNNHSSFKSPRSSSTYTSNINADIQAKLLAFQEQRQSKSAQNNQEQPVLKTNATTGSILTTNHEDHKNPSPLSLSTNSTPLMSPPNLPEGTGSLSTPPIALGLSRKKSLQQNKKAEKPLPPLPGTPPSLSQSSNSTHPLNDKSLNPVRPAPSLPINSQVSPQVAARLPKAKPSLSMRRGMKLPGGLPSLNNEDQSSTSSTSETQSSIKSSSESSQTNGSKKPVVPSMKSSGSVTNLIEKKGKLPAQQSMQLKGLFANYSKYIDIKSGSLNFKGKLSLDSKGVDFSSGSSFRISSDELEFIEELGRGNYGTVTKVLHKPTGITMAMKEVRLELDEGKFRQILMELEVLHKCNSPFIVDFYGAFFVEGAVYMCMEYMDGGSLDKIYGNGVDESHLAYVTESVIRGLMELKDNHNIIHRDVKPTNILVSSSGKVKLCDFGVSGNLVASLAKTNIGCQSYMAPERIKSLSPDDNTYSVQSDIWSLGLTMLETAKGSYPYPPETYDNIFSQLSAIVDGEPPALPEDYSSNAKDFVGQCLAKNPNRRPTYTKLLQHPWLVKYRNIDVQMGIYISSKLRENSSNKAKNDEANIEELNQRLKTPALHRGGAPQRN